MNSDELAERPRGNLEATGAFLRRELGDTDVSGPEAHSKGADAFRFDVDEGAKRYRLWVRDDFLWAAEGDVAEILRRWNIVGKLREAGTNGSVLLAKEGAFVRAEREPRDLG